MGMLDEATTLAALRAGLEAALRNGGRAGSDGVTVGAFAAAAGVELERLREEVTAGVWRPKPALRMKIPKAGGGYRALAVGCVRDRVLQHALAATLSAHLDATLHPSAWGWRRGRSAAQCLSAVDAALAAGKEWVLRGDIEEFFDRIPPQAALATLREHVHDDALVTVVGHLFAGGSLAGGCLLDPMLGTAQGSPVSPFLANLYLLAFDKAVEAAGFEMMRYGDDLCVPTLTRDDARRALDVVTSSLARLRLQMNPSKVAVRHLGEGFTFLGWSFYRGGRRAGSKAHDSLRRALDEARGEAPDPDAAVERVLRGWLTYYGSLAGVSLPEELTARAERFEAERAQAAQVGRSGARPPSRPATTADADGAEGVPDDPWTQAALLLRAARGTPEEAEVLTVFASQVGVATPVAAELAEALRRFDGDVAAEVFARLGRYDDAEQVSRLRRPAAAGEAEPAARHNLPVTPEEVNEPPRFTPDASDHELLLALFSGAEHTYFRDVRVGERIERQRVGVAPRVEHVKAHCEGESWMGVYPLRANNSVRWAAFRIVQAARTRGNSPRGGAVPALAGDDARAVLKAFEALGVTATVSVEPGRAWVLWVFFTEAITAARARAFLARVAHHAGPPDAAVTREIHPVQEVAKPDKPGTGMLLPLGRDPRTGERAWFCDGALTPLPDACGALRAVRPLGVEALKRAMGLAGAEAMAEAVKNTAPKRLPVVTVEGAVLPDAVALETSPFRELPRAQEVYRGCAVLRHLVDQAITGKGMAAGDRMLVADIVARLGDESGPAAEAVFRHLEDYRPGMGARLLQRVYPYPTSCGRIRQRLPELTARVGCNCQFRVPPGAYPTPVLHAVGAAEVPGMGEKVREVATRAGLARAAVAAMNEGRKELGTKAAALCARLADLRRQVRVLERVIAGVEGELDVLVEEAGESPLETPSGTLVRVTEGGTRHFVLKV